VHLPTGRAYT